jgi:hypothetical protein
MLVRSFGDWNRLQLLILAIASRIATTDAGTDTEHSRFHGCVYIGFSVLHVTLIIIYAVLAA